jgi:hypothetical protein
MTRNDLYKKLVDLGYGEDAVADSREAVVRGYAIDEYNRIANTLSGDQTFTFASGEVLTQRGLYLKALEVDSNDPDAYSNLARTLLGADDETVELPEGGTMNRQELFLKAIDLGSKDPRTYRGCAQTLRVCGTVSLLNGTQMNVRDLIATADRLAGIKSSMR